MFLKFAGPVLPAQLAKGFVLETSEMERQSGDSGEWL